MLAVAEPKVTGFGSKVHYYLQMMASLRELHAVLASRSLPREPKKRPMLAAKVTQMKAVAVAAVDRTVVVGLVGFPALVVVDSEDRDRSLDRRHSAEPSF